MESRPEGSYLFDSCLACPEVMGGRDIAAGFSRSGRRGEQVGRANVSGREELADEDRVDSGGFGGRDIGFELVSDHGNVLCLHLLHGVLEELGAGFAEAVETGAWPGGKRRSRAASRRRAMLPAVNPQD
jgi:hypothetical protein